MPNAKLYRLIILLIVSACTTQPKKVANAGPDLQCHPEATTGSWIMKSVCTTAAQRADERRQLDELQQAANEESNSNRPPPK